VVIHQTVGVTEPVVFLHRMRQHIKKRLSVSV